MSKTASPSSTEDFRVAQLKLTYVGPQEKPVPTLIAFSSAFRLTAEALRLLSTRIPIEVARRLQRVPDLEFLSRASFRAACMSVMGAGDFDRYSQAIWETAAVPSGKKLALSDYAAVQGGRAYANDPLPYTKWLAATPDELVRMVAVVERARAKHSTPPNIPALSCAWLRGVEAPAGAPLPPQGGELLLGVDSGRALVEELARALDAENTAGHALLAQALGRL